MKINSSIILLNLIAFTSLNSCQLPSAYLMKELKQYPKGLSKKDFISYNSKISITTLSNENWISFKEWNSKNRNYNFNEKSYFNETYFNKKDVKYIDSIVSNLSKIKKKYWVYPSIYKEIYGFKGTVWVSKKNKAKINKVQDENLNALYHSSKLVLSKKLSSLLYPTYKLSSKY